MKRGAGAKKHALLTEIADIVDDRVVTNDTYLTHISGLVSRIPVLYPFLDFCTKRSKGIVLSLDRDTTYSLELCRH